MPPLIKLTFVHLIKEHSKIHKAPTTCIYGLSIMYDLFLSLTRPKFNSNVSFRQIVSWSRTILYKSFKWVKMKRLPFNFLHFFLVARVPEMSNPMLFGGTTSIKACMHATYHEKVQQLFSIFNFLIHVPTNIIKVTKNNSYNVSCWK